MKVFPLKRGFHSIHIPFKTGFTIQKLHTHSNQVPMWNSMREEDIYSAPAVPRRSHTNTQAKADTQVIPGLLKMPEGKCMRLPATCLQGHLHKILRSRKYTPQARNPCYINTLTILPRINVF